MAILVVRHGETASNAARVVQLPETPLSERGLLQAERLAARLAGLGVADIVSSDQPRARVTAERIQAATGAPLELWPGLRERNLGALRGRPYAEVGHLIFDPTYAPDGGETWDEFQARAAAAWARACARAAALGDANLAVVTHGLFCRAVVDPLVAGGPRPSWPNASLTIVSALPPHAVELLCCTEHLAGC